MGRPIARDIIHRIDEMGHSVFSVSHSPNSMNGNFSETDLCGFERPKSLTKKSKILVTNTTKISDSVDYLGHDEQ